MPKRNLQIKTQRETWWDAGVVINGTGAPIKRSKMTRARKGRLLASNFYLVFPSKAGQIGKVPAYNK